MIVVCVYTGTYRKRLAHEKATILALCACYAKTLPYFVSLNQCCGTVTIYYGSGSGSDF
jgi:hypothetical protein